MRWTFGTPKPLCRDCGTRPRKSKGSIKHNTVKMRPVCDVCHDLRRGKIKYAQL